MSSPFIDDMARAYADADLVICRAGALTVSELAAVGVARVLVPFPAAVDDHQTRQRAVPGARGRGGADRGSRPDARAARRRAAGAVRRAAASCWRWPNARACVAKPRAAEELAAACLDAAGGRMSDRMRRINRIHFVGIGGSGMSGIAEVLVNLGYEVQGSDLKPNRGDRAARRSWARAS